MKVPLISKSGLLEFKNSSVLRRDHLYFLIMYTAKTEAALLCPLTECTKILSDFLTASSIKSNLSFVV
jgi:hypothetical protein